MVKDHVAEVLELFKTGFHCSQAVFSSFSEDFGLPRETALKIAGPFGGGLGGYGRTCGALTGAMLVLGLKYGADKANDSETSRICKEKTRELIEIFEKVYGTSICNELVGFNRSNLSGAELLEKRPHFQKICPKFLETVASFLEEEL
jgi:C_GCAxxG_C_C family probable redox protein